MKNLLFLFFILPIVGCIGPVKELERQIQDVYFDTGLDNSPELLPENFVNKVQVNQLWLKDFDNLPRLTELVFDNESIFLITEEGLFTKINQENGNTSIVKKVNVKVKAGIFSNDSNYFFFIDERNYLTKINIDGFLIWSVKISNSLNLKPIFYKNQLILKYVNNNIESFDVENGTSIWTYARQNPPLSINVQSPITIANDILYTGYPGGKVVIIEPESGSFLTELTLSRPRGVTEIDRTNDVAGRLAIIDDLLFAASYNGEISAFDRKSGSKFWSRKISSYHGIVSDKVNLIVPHENDSLFNFEINSGKTVWKNNDLTYRKISTPVIVGEYLLIIDYQGILHILDLNEGERVGIHQFGNNLDSLIDFGENTTIENTLNVSKIYKSNELAYILLSRKNLVKIQVNE